MESNLTDNDKRFINAQDLYKIVTLEDPGWSPDGSEVVFVRLDTDKAKNGYKRSIWRWRDEWGEARQFTMGGKADFMPSSCRATARMAHKLALFHCGTENRRYF